MLLVKSFIGFNRGMGDRENSPGAPRATDFPPPVPQIGGPAQTIFLSGPFEGSDFLGTSGRVGLAPPLPFFWGDGRSYFLLYTMAPGHGGRRHLRLVGWASAHAVSK